MSRHRTAPLNPPVNSEELRGFDLFDGDVHVDVDCLQKPNSSSILSPRDGTALVSSSSSTVPKAVPKRQVLSDALALAVGEEDKQRSRKIPLRSLAQLLDDDFSEIPAKKKIRKAAADKSTSAPSSVPSRKIVNPPVNQYASFEANDFSGLENICLNAGATVEGLRSFIGQATSRTSIVVSFLWSSLCSNHSSTTVRFCTLSVPCLNWNCSCDRHIRIVQADAELIGAVIFIPALSACEQSNDQKQEEFDDEAVFLLPLCECEGPDELNSSPLPHNRLKMPFFCETSLQSRWKALLDILQSETSRKIIFNIQLSLLPIFRHLFRERAVNHFATKDYRNLFDPKICMHLCDTDLPESALELESMLSRFGIRTLDLTSPDFGRVTKAVSRCASEMKALMALAESLSTQLHHLGSSKTLEDVEMPILCLLSEMEALGVQVDCNYIQQVERQLTEKKESIEQNVMDILAQESLNQSISLAKGKLNLASPDQVATLLYDRLQLPPPAAAVPGKHRSTSEEDLIKIRHLHPIVDLILAYRGCSKLLSTYIQGCTPFLCRYDSRSGEFRGKGSRCEAVEEVSQIHARWNQTAVRTGRLSCSKPNLQNIPNKQSIAGLDINMRLAFVARRGCVLISADYSQMEMRVLAHMCGDPTMLKLFHDAKGDIYRDLACKLFSKTAENITDVERTQAKTICLGVVYGMGNEAAAAQLKVDVKTVTIITTSFFTLFPQMKAWIQNIKLQARQHGLVRTLLGRVRHLPDIRSPNTSKSSTAARQAVNSVIQGTASDLMKSAMITVDRNLASSPYFGGSATAGEHDRRMMPKLLMQIHDELIYEVPGNIGASSGFINNFINILRQSLEKEIVDNLSFRVPLKINVKMGIKWGELIAVEYM